MGFNGKKALTGYGKALRARIELAERLTRELRRVPTQEELGPMPVPGDEDLYDAQDYYHGSRENFEPLKGEVAKPQTKFTSDQIKDKSRQRAEASKVANNGLVGVYFRGGKWEARFTYTDPDGVNTKGYTSRHECLWDAVAAREMYVRRHYGSQRPWLFCDRATVEKWEAQKHAS
ncbi:hypothetical protein UFOVP184_32 [uncultured Caudovirales phage]|uniref:Uncharacterized protein n=1 Tax=uncultured Caudovirales phage TaxID=2100421 RepID=A0A6J7WCL7_9CAUD|nr:hypothetical protein UFOVP184_32 [uncultured Caudovirales phage]